MYIFLTCCYNIICSILLGSIMKSRLRVYFFFFSVLLFSCEITSPYLILHVQDTYNSSHVSIPYAYKSESSDQTCHITLSKIEITGYTTVLSEEERMPEEGTLSFDLNQGRYYLQFSVLSDRGLKREVLAFLDGTATFIVTNE